ncbi:unnamed protein product [Lampetra planeri]
MTCICMLKFGEVSRGRYRPIGRREVLVAVKTLRWGASDRERGMFLSEAGVLGQFDHPNVLKLEGVITLNPPERIITEFMENGPLDSFLRENEGQFSILQLVGMLRGVGAGMRYLSERNFVHRDLAARNVLVNSNLVCKVSDFGLSRLMRGLDHNIPTYTASLVNEAFPSNASITGKEFRSASLCPRIRAVMKAVADQYRLPAPSNCPSALHSVMLQCWQARSRRPGRGSIPSCPPWIASSDTLLHSRSCSQPLLSPTPTDLSSVATVSDWLRALRMDRYQDQFERAHLDSLDRVSRLTMEDVQSLGVNLLGHQRKIVSAAQQLRAHLTQGQVEDVHPDHLHSAQVLPQISRWTWNLGWDLLGSAAAAFPRVVLLLLLMWTDSQTAYTSCRDSCAQPVFSIRAGAFTLSHWVWDKGALGETALHVAAMADNLEAAVALMDGAPELVNEPMTSDLFQGVTPLHIAVVNQNINLVHHLISRGADVATPRVTGLYFRKRIGGLIYYGEHILSFAACAGNEDIISMVMDAGASTRAQDSRGNTVLHILVLQPNKTIACQAMDLIMAHRRGAGSAGATGHGAQLPRLDAFQTGGQRGERCGGAFQHLVHKRRVVQWSLGPLTSNLYDLTEIDSWADGTSVLELIVGSQQREESYVTYEDNLRLAGEIISVLGALVILLLEIPDILRVGAKRYFGQTALGGPFHVILISYACLVVLLCVYPGQRAAGRGRGDGSVLGPRLEFFARGFEMLGPYVIMIQKIIFGDLTKFMWLSFIVLMGFSTSLWMVYMTQEPDSIPAYRSFPITLFSQFELSVGLIDLPVDHTFTTPPIVHVLHCAFSVVSYILLLNLLIAMMSDTHWRVAQERDELWRTQVVATTLMLERRLPRCLWPRLGVCGLSYGLTERWYLRVEDRNDPMFQKMRRYIKAFSKEDDKEKEEDLEKTDTKTGSVSEKPNDPETEDHWPAGR